MGLKREILERQLQQAETSLAAFTKTLGEQGITGKAQRLSPKWRGLNAEYRQVKRRLYALAEVDRINAEALQRRSVAENGDQTEAAE